MMGKVNFLELWSEKDSIIFQLGLSGDLTLEKLLGVKKEDVLMSIPYWLVLTRLTKKQLSLAKDKKTELPDCFTCLGCFTL